MGAMFRSEKMTLVQLFIQPEAAYHVISELGEAGCVQFRDLNEHVNIFQREFASEVKRCGEIERQLRYIETEIKKNDVAIPEDGDLPQAPGPRQIVELEAHIDKTNGDIRELTESTTNLKENYLELVQIKNVLERAENFFSHKGEASDDLNLTEDDMETGQLGFVTGVINKERVFSFEKMLWRIGKGNIYFREEDIDEPIEDPATGVKHKKCVFIAFYQGENLQSKVRKICTGFHANIFDCPVSAAMRNEQIKGIQTALEDIQIVLNQTTDHVRRLLTSVAKEIQNWTVMVSKMKAIYHTLNMFSQDVSRKCLIGEGWVPTEELPEVQKALADGAIACGSSVPSFLNAIETNETPPTFNRTNKFTQGFQNLIAAYSAASYRELNPALYTIVTFPFLFAVMFGDIGHGTIMALFGLWLVIAEVKIAAQKNKSEIFSIFFSGRYIILLMGIFSVYTGFIYNDIFSKSMNVFGSRWFVDGDLLPANFTPYAGDKDATILVELFPRSNYKGDPYYAGLDPAWQTAENRIIFLNSFKMKLSIVIGVAHMIFGLVVSTMNFIHFKKYSALFLDFVPKLLFLLFLFVYLVMLMFMKWIMYSGTYDGTNSADTSPGVDTPHGSSCAPSVLIYFINMMLLKEPKAPAKPCESYMYDGQESVQRVLLVGALVCIPVMLLGTPIYEMCKRKKQRLRHHNSRVKEENHADHGAELETIPEASALPSHDEEPMSEIFVHQAIHTIEYTLSTVSHTASYLRLWALSLAHGQLSDVLWSMVFNKALTVALPNGLGAPIVYVIFGAWAGLTVGILVLMEGLSAFLHTLRLHWVEFMSKFYEGTGYGFTPFSFKAIFDDETDEE